MDPKWIQILVILVFYPKMTSGAEGTKEKTVKEGELVEIECRPPESTNMIIWFRALDNSGMEYIASFTSNGIEKSKSSNFDQIFSHGTIYKNTLKLKAFQKSRDSGVYGCATLHLGKELKFGTATRLLGQETRKDTPVGSPTKAPNNQIAAVTPCNCNDKYKKTGAAIPSLYCSVVILGPLAGGCGLLLLLLIITAVYCNRIRTRRCPHHYKRKPRMGAPEKQMMTNRHV
ncbi:T-cell surface glycoprotein CD8 alpha chain isoform X2 [Stegastes partitus]|uniref:T-cell surface glycoprotein CD8 alpha chain-like n=1 Tax=Stegastes partitus TaxID=144197 RepID=A0A3B5AU32_9TELE|nr:PREDICTED: T-cell surface glycoprotein CD8 alpha chain-like isoform X2 [Stegastes partitus]